IIRSYTILSSPSSPLSNADIVPSPPKKATHLKPRRVTSSKQLLYVERHRKKRQAEFVGLQKSVVELEAQLAQMKQKLTLQSLLHPQSKWRQHATNERKRRAKAMLENKALRDAVEQQMQFTDTLVRAVQSVPLVTDSAMSPKPQDQWQYYHLVQDPVLRKAACHNICDREFGQLQNAFAEAGLQKSPVPNQLKHDYKQINHMIQVQTTVTARFSKSVNDIKDALWKCFTGTAKSDDPLMKKLMTTHTPIDTTLSYVTGTKEYSQGRMDRRLLCKLYDHPNSCEIVCRSIIHDESLPATPNSLLDEASWLTIETEGKDTLIKYFSKVSQVQNAPIQITKRWLELGILQYCLCLSAMNPSEAFISSLFDVTSSSFAVEWSNEEQNMLSMLLPEGQNAQVNNNNDEVSSTTSDSRKKQNLALQRHRKKRQAEHAELRRVAVELEDTLHRLQQSRQLEDILNPPSKWRKLAAEEIRLEQKARLENKHLKEMLKEHMEIAQTFTNLIEKKSDQTTFIPSNPTEKWKQLILVADPALRKAAIHSICDRQCEFVDSAFIEAGLIDANSEIQRHVSKFNHGAVELQTIVCRVAPLPLKSVAEASWQVMRGAVAVKNLDQEAKRLEDVDINTSYMTGWRNHPLGKYQRRVLCKRYFNDEKDPTQCTMVCRSLEQDELLPYDDKNITTNEVSWLKLESHSSGGTLVKYFQRIRPSSWKIEGASSEYWIETFSKHSKMIGKTIRDYMEQYEKEQTIEDNVLFHILMKPNQTFFMDVFDGSTFDYSVHFSPQEHEMLSLLIDNDCSSQSAGDGDIPPAKLKHNLALKRYRKKKREELHELKQTAVDLEERLLQLQSAKTMSEVANPPSQWKHLALNERKKEKEALVENNHLRQLVTQHMITAQLFGQMLEKTRDQPTHDVLRGHPEDKWKFLILTSENALRLQAMHLILDQEYNKTQDTLCEANLIDALDEFQKHIAKFGCHSEHEFHAIVHRRTALKLASVVEGTWNVIRGTAGNYPHINRTCTDLIDVDENTSYVAGWFDHALGRFQRRVLCKKYYNHPNPKEATKCIIVCRSIEEDELFPYDSTTPYSVEVSWHLLEMTQTGADFKYFQKFRPSKWTMSCPWHWEKTLENSSSLMRKAVNEYIDRFQTENKENSMNPNEAFILGTLDPLNCDYSVQWSSHETEILSSLLGKERPSPKATPSKHSLALQQYRKRKRAEYLQLKQAAKELEERLQQLKDAKTKKESLQPPSKWQKLALTERQKQKTSQQENQQLRDLVQSHMVTAQIFANVLEKTWEQSKTVAFLEVPEAKWKQLILVKDTSLRTSAMQQILDREHDNFHSAYIEAGLIDATHEFQKHIAKFDRSSSHEFHTIVHRVTKLPFAAVVEGTWNVILGTADGIPNISRSCKEIIDIDDNMSYVTGWFDHALGKFQRRVLCKRYYNEANPNEATQCIIVCRSIEDDELSPYDSNTLYSNEVSWHLLEATDEGTDFKYFQKFRPSKWTDSSTKLSSHDVQTLEQASNKMRRAVNQYIDEFGKAQTKTKALPST
ncbi:hypothetical protein THRCLA_21915, partial [Thraustotheca clavata]